MCPSCCFIRPQGVTKDNTLPHLCIIPPRKAVSVYCGGLLLSTSGPEQGTTLYGMHFIISIGQSLKAHMASHHVDGYIVPFAIATRSNVYFEGIIVFVWKLLWTRKSMWQARTINNLLHFDALDILNRYRDHRIQAIRHVRWWSVFQNMSNVQQRELRIQQSRSILASFIHLQQTVI